ncbi:nicotinate-nucleotide--dimethylbenzimidazole phosphoribosyltransferase [Parabacteroides bouchesdurhonensis]|uniref:nicotinate-nucleotide--dimethylbenzimidazole phosphoribosyltransferase n=1 Tax=Parabacteroides bouchesdurhonensis TaxID=1936995 RepID=UPI000C85EEE1|nr:nicotinate-nucleotide--dimethylbenzimidazole phosphoribosyltransferase [Parabacteroides bouchesdurhonensis]
MITFHIEKPDNALAPALEEKINSLTKPKGSLGRLEELAIQIGLIQQTLNPTLSHPINVIYASDHGIADEGVSQSPKEVTRQVVYNFLNGGAGICYLARQHGFEIKIVDGGVDFEFPTIPELINKKIRKNGTRNFLHEAAMTQEEMELALQYGADVVTDCYKEGCNIISFGEMGIGNTSASSMWMTCLTKIPLIDCVGAGSGLNSEGIKHKYNVLKASLDNYRGDGSTLDIMRYFGGYEMVMAVGGMLRAAELKMIILIDGFIMTNCVLVASRLYPEILPYCIFGHCGDEAGHKRVLDILGANPLLNLGLRLGEGTGAVCAYPIVDSAIRMINEMHTFEQEAITKYF